MPESHETFHCSRGALALRESGPLQGELVEPKHLRYLIAINEERTFVRAAERLHLAQPALSRQIHKFEKAIGTPVFERRRTGVTLTPGGEICLHTARSVIQRVD